MNQLGGCNVYGRGDNIVARLAAIDVIIRMRGRKPGDHLVRIHVGGCSAAGLENIDHKFRIELTGGDAVRGGGYAGCYLSGDLAQFSIYTRSGGFDEPQCANERPCETEAADREVLDGTLRLRAIQRMSRDSHFAHRVVFNAEGLPHVPMIAAGDSVFIPLYPGTYDRSEGFATY